MSTTLDVTIERLLREVLPRRLHKLELQEGMSLRGELGVDSIGLMSLAFRLEEEFQIDLLAHADKVANVQTLGDVNRLVQELRQDGGA